MTISKENAEEYTQTLAQHMVASYRQIELAHRMGIPKTLGYESLRDWVKNCLGGYMQLSTQERKKAINELEAQGYSQRTIGEILGVSQSVVSETRSDQRRSHSGSDQGKQSKSDRQGISPEALAKAQADAQVARAAKAQADSEIEELKEKLQKAASNALVLKREATEAALANLTEQERERAKKEANAYAQEMGEKMLTGISNILVTVVVKALQEATEVTKQIVQDCNGIPTEYLKQIEEAHAAFIEELNVARMSEKSTQNG